LVFRDSTADFLLDWLAQHFGETLFIRDRGLVHRDVIDELRPDLVIQIMAERFVGSYSQFPVFA
jgi:hypothetical protein